MCIVVVASVMKKFCIDITLIFIIPPFHHCLRPGAFDSAYPTFEHCQQTGRRSRRPLQHHQPRGPLSAIRLPRGVAGRLLVDVLDVVLLVVAAELFITC